MKYLIATMLVLFITVTTTNTSNASIIAPRCQSFEQFIEMVNTKQHGTVGIEEDYYDEDAHRVYLNTGGRPGDLPKRLLIVKVYPNNNPAKYAFMLAIYDEKNCAMGYAPIPEANVAIIREKMAEQK